MTKIKISGLVIVSIMIGFFIPINKTFATQGCPVASTTYSYEIVELGTGVPYGINKNCQVVGQSSTNEIFLYSSGSVQILGTGAAYGVNGNREIVGVNGAYHAFLSTSSTPYDLGPGIAFGINDNADVVGADINGNAFKYSNGTTFELGPGKAMGINNSGRIVGSDSLGNIVLFNLGTSSTQIIYTAGKTDITATINNKGNVAGSRIANSHRSTYAVLYDSISGNLINLGGLSVDASSAMVGASLGLNDSDQVVGWANAGVGGGIPHAFLYSNNQLKDLNTLIDPVSGWTLVQANAINNQGYIVGYGTNPSGDTKVFLLVPKNPISQDASLNSLVVSNGTLSPTFSSTTLTYNVTLSAGASVIPVISATTSNSNANRIITQASTLPGSATILVTAQDGITQQTYRVNFVFPQIGTLVVNKKTLGGNGTFHFTGTGSLGNFVITTNNGDGNITFPNLLAGSYSITETNIPHAWDELSSNCFSVSIVVGSTTSCTITNGKGKYKNHKIK